MQFCKSLKSALCTPTILIMTKRFVPSKAGRTSSRAEIVQLKDVLIVKRSANRYNKTVWIFVETIMFWSGAVAEDLESLDPQCCWYLEMLWAEGETKSVADTTSAAIEHLLNRRRILTGSSRLFAAWKHHKQAFQCRHIPKEILIGLAGFFFSIG